MAKTLAQLQLENKTVDAVCPRCRGLVIVPTEVTEVPMGGGNSRPRYDPLAHCTRCSVGYSWHSKKNPTSGQQSIYNGLTNVWFSDRQLNCSAPKVIDG